MSEYIDDLQKGHPRAQSRYLAALNIKKALEEIASQSHIPDFFRAHKIHSGNGYITKNKAFKRP